jgi:MFS family permease
MPVRGDPSLCSGHVSDGKKLRKGTILHFPSETIYCQLMKLGSNKLWTSAFYLAACLRLLSCIPFILDDDEAWWVVAARGLRTPWEYYFRAVDHKPPGIVWFYWFSEQILHSGDPRVIRAFYSLLTVGAALVLGWMARRFSERSGIDFKVAAFFLLAAPMASPKLLSVTADGLLLLFVIPAYGIALFATFPGASLLAGVLLGGALLVKQTAVFFALPLLLVRRPRAFGFRDFFSFLVGSALVYLSAVWAVDPTEFFYWNWTYPREVLARGRATVFDGRWEMFTSLLVFCLALFPLLWAAARAKIPRALRDFRVLWLMSGIMGIGIGQGLFLHYFLLVLPPLVLLASAGLQGRGVGWLAAGYGLACAVCCFASAPLFWGTDLLYYRALGKQIELLTRPKEAVLVWGGSVLPLTYSGNTYPGRFLLPRFAEKPYETEHTQRLYHEELERAFPCLVVDVHERGDNRLNNPLESEPWIKERLKDFRVYVSPGLPWVKFYLKDPPPELAGLSKVETSRLSETYAPFPEQRRSWNITWRSETLARARTSLELLGRQGRSASIRDRANLLRRTGTLEEMEKFLGEASEGKSESVPLPWRSTLWWVQAAIVELQPKLFPR